jgi:hypothetical protein
MEHVYVNDYGSKYWRVNGILHREDGPAVEYMSGGRDWWIDGKRHRIDGPAIIYSDGRQSWYLNDIKYSKEEWFKKLTPEQQYNYLWKLNE